MEEPIIIAARSTEAESRVATFLSVVMSILVSLISISVRIFPSLIKLRISCASAGRFCINRRVSLLVCTIFSAILFGLSSLAIIFLTKGVETCLKLKDGSKELAIFSMVKRAFASK